MVLQRVHTYRYSYSFDVIPVKDFMQKLQLQNWGYLTYKTFKISTERSDAHNQK